MPRCLVLCIALGLPAVGLAAEPRAAFSVESGWLQFAVTQDGQPVPAAAVAVFNEQGTPWASGETDAEGRGSFPLPRGDSLLVELKVGSRSADLITLRRTAEGVVPANVLLSFGLRPCCRVPSRGGVYRPEAEVEITPASRLRWLPLTAMAACLLAGVSLLVLAIRSRPGTST